MLSPNDSNVPCVQSKFSTTLIILLWKAKPQAVCALGLGMIAQDGLAARERQSLGRTVNKYWTNRSDLAGTPAGLAKKETRGHQPRVRYQPDFNGKLLREPQQHLAGDQLECLLQLGSTG